MKLLRNHVMKERQLGKGTLSPSSPGENKIRLRSSTKPQSHGWKKKRDVKKRPSIAGKVFIESLPSTNLMQ